MSNEQATNDAEQKPGKLTESIDRMADKLEKVIKMASSAYDRLAHVELRDGQGAAWCLLSKAIGEIRHVLGPCAIMPEACFHKLHEFANQPRGTGEFFTPKEVLDAVTANPPLGDVKDAPQPLDPNAPEIAIGDEPWRKVPCESVGMIRDGGTVLGWCVRENAMIEVRAKQQYVEGKPTDTWSIVGTVDCEKLIVGSLFCGRNNANQIVRFIRNGLVASRLRLRHKRLNRQAKAAAKENGGGNV